MALRIIVIAIILLVLLGFVGTETIRFNEKAVRTTFGAADQSDVITEPGLARRIPLVNRITKYDTRLRFVQSPQETQQTKGNAQLLVTSFLTWRVSDPLLFYKRFSGSGSSPREHYREAERILEAKLRAAGAQVSNFSTADLLSAGEQGSKLADLETAMLTQLKGAGDTAGGKVDEAALSSYGIEPVSVGIVSLGLPQDTSGSVFDRMKAARERIANEFRAKGTSEAAAIRSDAENDAKKISAFAEQLAESIRTQGRLEAVQYLEAMNQDPKLAVFVQQMTLLRSGLSARGTTVVLPSTLPGLEYLRMDAGERLKLGQLGVPGLDDYRAAVDAAKQSAAGEGKEGGTR